MRKKEILIIILIILTTLGIAFSSTIIDYFKNNSEVEENIPEEKYITLSFKGELTKNVEFKLAKGVTFAYVYKFLENYLPNQPGKIVDIDTNEVIGEHIGLMNYTIGQRRGLDIGGTKERMFVVGKNLKDNILYICIGEDNDYLMSTSCIVDSINYLGDEKITKCTAKFRYRQPDIDVEIKWLSDDEIEVIYPQGVKAVTPGQACVLYNGEECLGGGIIKEVRKNGEKLWYL